MEEIYYDFWAASLQDGYVGNLIDIVERAGGSRGLYEMNEEEMLSKLSVSGRMVNHIINRRNTINIKREYDDMMARNIKFVRYTDPEYPKKLSDISSRPYALFCLGRLPEENKPRVAIIGARDCSEYGRLMAEYFGDRLAGAGIDIVSGMAYGIDGIAQMSAIDAGGKSYAILGCGVDVVYPRSNRRLYERLIECGGVISEYIPGTQAVSRNFPPRNRIISGLSDIVLVVEAKSKSGTLITADMAIEQGKDVGVIPGRITDPLSLGCLNLIKQGAIPIVTIEDITECLNISNVKDIDEKGHGKASNLTAEEMKIYECLDYYPRGADCIANLASTDIKTVLNTLAILEIKGMVKCVGQSSFVKMS